MFVVDSSFVIAGLLPEEHSEFVELQRDEIISQGASAPSLLVFEVGNVLWRKLKRAEISRAERDVALRAFNSLDYVLDPPPDVSVQFAIASLAEAHDVTAYDAAYLELAKRAGAVLATLDKKLARIGAAEGLRVRAP